MGEQYSTSMSSFWKQEASERSDRARIRARVSGLHCSLCTGTIEKALGRMPGVDKVAVSLTHEQALVEYDPKVVKPEIFLKTLRDIGYNISDPRRLRSYEEEERDLMREGRRFLVAIVFSLLAVTLIAQPTGLWSALLSIGVFLSMAVLLFLVLRRSSRLWVAVIGATVPSLAAAALFWLKRQGAMDVQIPWLVGALALIFVFAVGEHFLRMAYQSIRRGIFNQHVLLEAGAFAGLAGGVIGLVAQSPDYPTAPFFAVSVMVVTYHTFSEWLSLIVKTRSSQAVKRLLDLQPETAQVVKGGTEITTPIDEVQVADRVRIRPGERIPIDGEVIDGHSAVDLSLVTGEPLPVVRRKGDVVVGGSINGTGTLLVKVTVVGEGTFLNLAAQYVEDARALKPGILHLVDRVLRIYTPVVFTVSLLAAVFWALGAALLGMEPDIQRAVFAGLSVLVMGYPCALGISAPLSIVRGAGEAAEKGVLMRTGEAFQAFRLARYVVLDKTGTLTKGRPLVQEVEPAQGTTAELIALAGAAEASSEHPLGQALVDEAFERGIDLPEVSDFEAVPGKGVVATIGGHQVVVGSSRFLRENGVELGPISQRVSELEDRGRTVIVVAQNDRLEGLVALGDQLRDGAKALVESLHRAGVKTVLLTGDNERTARRIAGELDIQTVYAGVLPQDKAQIISELQRQGTVAMVGDGINDAAALMQANVGIAMGSGTDIAIESADIIVTGDRLESILDARQISRYSYGKMLQNVLLAVMFNGIGIPVAATGLIYPIWAMAAMAISVTAIFLNSLWGRPSLFFDAILSVGRPQSR
ncbi:MAG: cation-translocating P-type ATPase [Spirochaetia bacterium]